MKGNRILILAIFILVAGAVVFIGWNSYFGSQTNRFSKTEIMEGWTQYENERFGFSFSYPDDWHRYNEESGYALVSVSPISPNDPKLASGAGLLSSFNVGFLQKESIEAYLQSTKENPLFERFDTSEIKLDNGMIVPLISYFHPIGTDRIESFIKLSDGTILHVWFSSSEETYAHILRSFRWQ